MHEALYAAYDAILCKEADEKKKLLQRRSSRGSTNAEEAVRRNLLLERKRQRLLELPALSSMIQISEAEAEVAAATASEQQRSANDAEASDTKKMDGFERMRQCRLALDALDVAGWKRSYHQRMFHEAYIAACARYSFFESSLALHAPEKFSHIPCRPFWKLDPPGSFARAHQKILDLNSWDNLAQEILISTPRRCPSPCHPEFGAHWTAAFSSPPHALRGTTEAQHPLHLF